MMGPPAAISYGVGGCGRCRHVFLVTPELRTCPLCDGPVGMVLAFLVEDVGSPVVEEVVREFEPEAEPPIPFTVVCPHCDQAILLEVSQEAIAVVTPSAPPPEEEAGEPPSRTEPPSPPPTVEEEPQEPMAGPHDPPPVES